VVAYVSCIVELPLTCDKNVHIYYSITNDLQVSTKTFDNLPACLYMSYPITDYSPGNQGDQSLKCWPTECGYAETL